jgi:hypothetical protein
MAQVAPADSTTAFVQPNGRLRDRVVDWLSALVKRVNECPYVLTRIALTAQGASIATTTIPLGVLTEGLYRVTLTARITRAASVSSSLTVSISWTSGGVLCTVATAALTGNTTDSVQMATYLIAVDSGTAIQYSTTYASVGAPSALYSLDLIVERVPDPIART